MRTCAYLNNIVEQDHRAIKARYGRSSQLPAARITSLWLGGSALRPIMPELAQFDPGGRYRWSVDRALPDNDPQTLLIFTGAARAAGPPVAPVTASPG